MALTRADGKADLIDVLDRVLDKGIVIDAWIRVTLAGIDLLTVEARAVIASFETYLKYAENLARRDLIASFEQARRKASALAEKHWGRRDIKLMPSSSALSADSFSI
jgi:gas vesicle structural protein